MQPLDPELNEVVLEMARRLLPKGFEVSDDAPQTFEELKYRLDAGAPMVVWSGGSTSSIYADPYVNYAFRAWHDWCHWTGGHGFTLAGEHAVYRMMCSHLIQYYGPTLKTRSWCRILRAEILGQLQYFLRCGKYPDDQRAFIERYLEHDEASTAA